MTKLFPASRVELIDARCGWGSDELAINIPQSQVPSVEKLFSLPPDQLETLQGAIREAGAQVRIEDFANELASNTGLDAADAFQFAAVLGSLYVTATTRGENVEGFVEEVLQAVKSSPRIEVDFQDEQEQAVRSFLHSALSSHDTLGVTAKALSLMNEQDKLFCRARIMTDIRPIFEEDEEGEPGGSLLVHTLRITYHRGHEEEDAFIALDSEDLRELQRLVRRAIRKEEVLNKALDGKLAIMGE